MKHGKLLEVCMYLLAHALGDKQLFKFVDHFIIAPFLRSTIELSNIFQSRRVILSWLRSLPDHFSPDALHRPALGATPFPHIQTSFPYPIDSPRELGSMIGFGVEPHRSLKGYP
jgi:hypothetical protein